MERETEAARRAGLPAEHVATLDVPFPAVAAMMLRDQAQFHPRKYLLGLAALVDAAGGRIVTRNRVTEISGQSPFRLRTEQGEIRAPVVVVASHYPIVEQGFFVSRIHPRRSYVVAAPLEQSVPEGMYINTGEPTRSMRTAMLDDGHRLLLVGGEGHRVGQETHTARRYDALERYTREHFTVGATAYRWSTQDNHSVDGLPFVGPVEKVPGLFVATGFAGWGMTNGTMAALTIASAVQGDHRSWAPLFALDRSSHLRTSAKRMVTESLNVARQQFGPSPGEEPTVSTIEAGEGKVVSVDGSKVAVSRDETGALHAVSARCTHMGCVVTWNEAEASWDCACHGSRFTARGEVLHGPALHPLEPAALSAEARRTP